MILIACLNDFLFINDPLNGPHKQHDARRLENGNLMIFDNGHGGNNPRPARVLEYEIDEQNLTATLIWEYSHPEGYVSQNQGSSQRLENGNTLDDHRTFIIWSYWFFSAHHSRGF